MKMVQSNIENLPVDVIGMLMKSLLAEGFEDCFKFFLAWAQTQRPNVITCLLEGFPLRALYKHANVGSAGDKACFDRFFGIAERLGVPDAILYKRCYDILNGVGDINVHLAEIDNLVRHGHFTAMVASFSLRNTFKNDPIGRSLRSLSAIFEHRDFKHGIVPTLNYLESISLSCGKPLVGLESPLDCGCQIHHGKEKAVGPSKSVGVFECLLCAIGLMGNVFPRKVPVGDHVVGGSNFAVFP